MTTRRESNGHPRKLEVACTVRVSHTFEDLSAHVELDDDLAIHPGDVVLVHGAPINPPYGEVRTERRMATVTRASWLERAWTQITGDFDCISLLEISFSGEKTS